MNILVIGGTKGIGLSLVNLLLADGHRPIVAARNMSPDLQALNIEQFAYDTTADTPLPTFEQLDGLVYLPGTINLKPFNRLTLQDFRTDFETNVVGAVKVIQHYLPAMRKSAQASVVMFSTVAVGTGMPFHASVAASKGAVEGLIKSLAAEYAPHVRFNAIAPSLTNTPLAERLLNTEAKIEASAKSHPLKRIGHPNDIAQMAYFLLSEKASWITGQVFSVDGGLGTLKLSQ